MQSFLFSSLTSIKTIFSVVLMQQDEIPTSEEEFSILYYEEVSYLRSIHTGNKKNETFLMHNIPLEQLDLLQAESKVASFHLI